MPATRIKPPMGLDNAWWWQMADAGKLGIQRCLGCHTLRHPPRPMCGDCHSLEWDAVEASGRGTICSFTVLHHPKFPGYNYPLIIVLVDLEEGTRLTSQLVDCAPEDLRMGMPLRVAFRDLDENTTAPVFRPAELEDDA